MDFILFLIAVLCCVFAFVMIMQSIPKGFQPAQTFDKRCATCVSCIIFNICLEGNFVTKSDYICDAHKITMDE